MLVWLFLNIQEQGLCTWLLDLNTSSAGREGTADVEHPLLPPPKEVRVDQLNQGRLRDRLGQARVLATEEVLKYIEINRQQSISLYCVKSAFFLVIQSLVNCSVK